MKRETSKEVRKLPSNWSTMTDVDRAEAVKRLLGVGMSGREIAKALKCSESLIRHLKPLSEALPEEKDLARLGKVSTRELRRRIAERKAEKAHKQEQADEQARLEAARQGATHILEWFNKEEKIAYPHAEQIVLEARRKLREAERDGTLPKGKAPAGLPVSEIIRRCNRALPPSTDDVIFVERYANWLARWTYCVMPDSRIWEKALDIALNEFMARPM
jgi:DNA-binding transcriptional MerR regulator